MVTKGDERRVYLPHPELFESLQVGNRVLIDDGRVQLRITAVETAKITTIVEVGGPIVSHKGINVPDSKVIHYYSPLSLSFYSVRVSLWTSFSWCTKSWTLTGYLPLGNKWFSHDQVPMVALTEKDREDLEFGLSLNVDWVALSFVQSPEDIYVAREAIRGRAPLLAKIEKPGALRHLKEVGYGMDAGLSLSVSTVGVGLHGCLGISFN